ncbi:hypothetical protein GOBAR_DD21117 [Gossypium barbadense]|nr:hypothetical protein GOBAR_DD21117 [Gossypium barbadense]
MELVDDENMETMIAIYCGNRSDQNASILLFAELASVEPTEDLTTLGEEHGAQEPYMLLIDPDVVHIAEFSEYPEILSAHRQAVDSDSEELFIGRDSKGINFVLLKTRHLPISSVFSTTFYRLATLMPRMGQQQVNQMEVGHVFVEYVRDAMVANRRMARSMNVEVYSRRLEKFRVTKTIGYRPGIPPRSYGVDLPNRRCDCRRFQTLHYPCPHVMAACAKVLLNVEQFVDDVYTLEHTLCV